MTSSMYWCFTLNSDPRSFLANLGRLHREKSQHIVYICGQLEEASHLHFQGYVQLKRSRRLSWLRNNISAEAHFEVQRGTNKQARDYCCKEDGTEVADSFIECGQFKPGRSGQGARNDVHALRDAVKEGRSQRSLIEDDDMVYSFAKFIKFHDRVRSLYRPPDREEPREVHLYVGRPGTGKTRKAKQENPGLFEIPITNGTLWLDGYDQHEVVLFDDFMGRGSKMTLDNLLKFLDRYVQQVPIKGAYVWFNPRKIIVTTNYHPRGWYNWNNRESSYSALKRRFTAVYSFYSGPRVSEEDVEEYFTDQELWPEEIDLTK